MVYGDPNYQLAVTMVDDRTDGSYGGNYFLVEAQMRDVLADDLDRFILYTYVNTFGVPSLWPVKLPKDGRDCTAATQSSLNLARLGQSRWIRAIWSGKMYMTKDPIDPDSLPQPVWPRETFAELLGLAFGARRIRTVEHPLVLKLMARKPSGT
jgi:hypothetical protein